MVPGTVVVVVPAFYFSSLEVYGASVIMRTLFRFIFPRDVLPLQSYWSLSCDHGLHCGDAII